MPQCHASVLQSRPSSAAGRTESGEERDSRLMPRRAGRPAIYPTLPRGCLLASACKRCELGWGCWGGAGLQRFWLWAVGFGSSLNLLPSQRNQARTVPGRVRGQMNRADKWHGKFRFCIERSDDEQLEAELREELHGASGIGFVRARERFINDHEAKVGSVLRSRGET